MEIDWTSIEKKWRDRWNATKDYEANPDTRPKKFITVAYPYPNSPQHIGHGRTYTIADVHARFCRMQGNNVLFPMAFHYTGTPILAMAKRVEAGDAEIINNLKNIYNVDEESIKGFVEPIKIADYFHEEIKAGMIEIGYSIDWRREFTTIDPVYKKFIQWQINTLRQKELIIQGSHPVGWCPKDQNPVSQHDTQGDVEPDFTEYVLIKFQFGEYTIPTATLRPETIFGVVNLWVNPEIIYQKITVDGQKWIVSKECAYKLEFLDKKITYEGEIKGADLVGKQVTVPHRNEPVLMLPASFVRGNTGTAIVMSVPAHAPFDYQALEDLRKTDSELGAKISAIKPISIIQTPGYGDIPAKEAIEKFGIKNQDDPKLEEATKEVYGKEFYGGKLKPNTEQFAGTKIAYVKDGVKKWLTEKGFTDILLELTNTPVKCRCGAQCVVKVLNNQWFLNYGDKDWKESATQCFDSMNILPQEIKPEFQYVIGWLRERACARQHGLGTILPWDKDWIVESLSDSVIYMAYYTIAKFVNNDTLTAQNLSDEFFDHIFLDKGEISAVSELAKISVDTIKEIKKEFQYFYPVDSRHSGRDLVPSHLTFFVLNHVAIFPKEKWPKEIVVNGSVLMKGSKMSKSMGNIIPLRKAIADYGADPIRLGILMSAELLQDADFNLESVAGIKNKLEGLLEQCCRLEPQNNDAVEPEDVWIKSRVQSLIMEVTHAVEKMRLREALHSILFSFESDISWYIKRAHAKNRGQVAGIMHEINTTRVAMLAPFAPHIAEEMWEKLGNTGMVTKSKWPQASKSQISSDAIQSEELLKSTIADIVKILKVTKITPQKIMIYTADALKSKVYHIVLEKIVNGETNMGAIMKELIANPQTQEIKKNPDFVQKTIKDILSDPTQMRKTKLESKDFQEKSFLINELTSIIKNDLGIQIQVYGETDSDIYDPKNKARHARPYKPALLIE